MLVNQNAGRRLRWAWGAILLLAGAAASAQELYPTPEQAVQALLAAVESEQPAALQAVFGPNTQELGSGDPVADATSAQPVSGPSGSRPPGSNAG